MKARRHKKTSPKSTTSIMSITVPARLMWIQEVCGHLIGGSESARTLLIDMRGHLRAFNGMLRGGRGHKVAGLHPSAVLVGRNESLVFFTIHSADSEDDTLVASVPLKMLDGNGDGLTKLELRFNKTGGKPGFVPVTIRVWHS